jgi:hypothetical protein
MTMIDITLHESLVGVSCYSIERRKKASERERERRLKMFRNDALDEYSNAQS